MTLCPWCGTGILEADPVSSHNGHIWHSDCLSVVDDATDALIAQRPHEAERPMFFSNIREAIAIVRAWRAKAK